MENRVIELRDVIDEINRCQRCGLHKTRTRPVPGDGGVDPKIVLLGEAPGENEDRTGKPFVGAAGRFLSELLEIAGLDRERDCWIGNRVKCRPPGNRDPEPGELAACLPYLERQLQILRPDVVVTLGRFATWYYIPGAKISQIHGRVQPPIRGTVIYPVYHPSAALHNPAYRDVLKADFERLDRLLPRIKARLEELRQKEDPFPAGV